MVQSRIRNIGRVTRLRLLVVFRAFAVAAFLLAATTAHSELASDNDMYKVCGNWLKAMVQEQGNWAGSRAPGIKESQILYGGDTALGLLYAIEPTGYILVPYLKALPPVMAYSDQSDLDVRDTVGMVQLLRDVLRSRATTFIANYGSLNAVTPQKNGTRPPSMWDVYTLDDQEFANRLGAMQPLTQGDILLNGNNWSQGYPWNLNCPPDQGCTRTPVGCVATSASQIMRYWQWPSRGEGSHCYMWHGQSNSAQLCASFNHTYDWANMPLGASGNWTSAQLNALAGLSSDVGIAFNMMYGCDGSGAYIDTDVWSRYFWYDPTTHLEYRSDYTAQGWFDLIVSECEAKRPMQFAIQPLAHALVCDGWRIFSGNQIHMNYGWGGSTTGWFFIDNIYGSSPTYEYMRVGIKPSADSFHVYLTVESANPASGVAVSVAPSDTNGLGNGSTPFIRDYSPDKLVTLGAPMTADGNSFAKWQRDGIDYPGGTTVAVTTDMNHTMTSVYLSCTEAVGLPWATPRSPVCVNTTYAVSWRGLAGASGYEIRENADSWVSAGTDTSKSFIHPLGGYYVYEVRAVSACGQGAASSPLTVSVESNAPSAPGQPWADPSVPVCLNSQYTVSWNPVPGADGYQLRENGGGWQNQGAATVWYGMKSAVGVYTYDIRATNACGSSGPSLSVNVTVSASGAGPTTPGQPSFLPPSPICAGRQCTVRWDAVPNAEYYEIRENGGTWSNCGAARMWSVIKNIHGTYSYEVRAANGCGSSAPSPAASLMVGGCHSLIVFSLDPDVQVPIVMSALDQDGLGNGPTPFARTYYAGTLLTLQAPATFDGCHFLKWQRDDVDYSVQPSITLSIDADRTMTAVFSLCNCPAQGDINGDSALDVFDVINVIGIAFSGDTDPHDSGCPKTRGDVNNDGVTDVFDVIYLIATAFSGGANPVNPCGP